MAPPSQSVEIPATPGPAGLTLELAGALARWGLTHCGLPTRGDLMARGGDDLKAYIAERSADDPQPPRRIEAALRRRELLCALAEVRQELADEKCAERI